MPTSDMHQAAPVRTSSSRPSISPPTHPSSPRTTRPSTPEPQPHPSSIQAAFESLFISDPEQEMFRSLAVIFRSAQEQEGSVNLTAGGAEFVWTSLQRADTSSRQGLQDTSALRATRDILEQMLWNQSHLLVDAAKVLADSSRDGSAAHETNGLFPMTILTNVSCMAGPARRRRLSEFVPGRHSYRHSNRPVDDPSFTPRGQRMWRQW